MFKRLNDFKCKNLKRKNIWIVKQKIIFLWIFKFYITLGPLFFAYQFASEESANKFINLVKSGLKWELE